MTADRRPDRDRSAPWAAIADERGYALAMVAMLLFAFFGIAGLVIDVGLARLTQSIMQSAADTGALEALRFRDELPRSEELPPGVAPECGVQSPPGPVTPEQLDCARRVWVRDRVFASSGTSGFLFNEDATVTGSAQLGNLGAGPLMTLTGGSGDEVSAHQTLGLPSVRAYKPDTQLNLEQQTPGDMAAGTYDPHASHGEAPDYRRQDFPLAGPGAAAAAAPGFLVRLRRTGDLDSVAGVSSSGPSVPYVFARGSTLSRVTAGRGISVRGTSVADARFALAVGRTNPAENSIGLPFGGYAISRSLWCEFAVDSDNPVDVADVVSVTIDEDAGTLSAAVSSAACRAFTEPRAGRFVGSLQTIDAAGGVVSIGLEVPTIPDPATPSLALLSTGVPGVVPIFAPVTSLSGATADRVIGFGFIHVVCESPPCSMSGPVTLQRADRIAAYNATAHVGTLAALAARLSAPPQSQPIDWEPAMATHLHFFRTAGVPRPLSVPVIVR